MSEDTESEPVRLGDGRRKHITLISPTGDQTTYSNSYLQHSKEAFIVSSDESFPAAETTRYTKSEIGRIEIDQHHSRCFITTAVANDEETLEVLRNFRDDALAATAIGRVLIAGYKALSPPIAHTLAQHPHARTTRVVRGLVNLCAQLAHSRNTTHSSLGRVGMSLILTVLYIIGVFIALVGHFMIQLQAAKKPVPLKD